MIKKSLLELYEQSTEDQLNEGLNWYTNAHMFAYKLSEEYGIDFDKVCGVISALSPSVSWDKNKENTEAMLFEHRYKTGLPYNYSTYGNNVKKAKSILEKGYPDKFFNMKSSPKTLSFYMNILDPELDRFVTIDRHAYCAWRGWKKTDIKRIPKLTGKHYTRVAKSYVKGAKHLNIHPSQLQAVVWITYRDLQNKE